MTLKINLRSLLFDVKIKAITKWYLYYFLITKLENEISDKRIE